MIASCHISSLEFACSSKCSGPAPAAPTERLPGQVPAAPVERRRQDPALMASSSSRRQYPYEWWENAEGYWTFTWKWQWDASQGWSGSKRWLLIASYVCDCCCWCHGDRMVHVLLQLFSFYCCLHVVVQLSGGCGMIAPNSARLRAGTPGRATGSGIARQIGRP